MRLYVPLAAILCCILLSCHSSLGRLHLQGDLSLYDIKKGDDISKYASQTTYTQIQQRNELIERGIGSAIAGIFGGAVKVVSVLAKYLPVVVKIASHGLQITSLALSLGNAVSGGCMSYPNICTLRDQIEVIENRTVVLAAEIKSTYEPMTKDYRKLQDIVENNIYITRYIEDVLDDVEGIRSVSETVEQYLMDKLNTTLNVDVTSEEYLKMVVRPSEYMLRNVKKFYDDTRKDALKEFGKGLAIQLGVQLISIAIEGGINKAMNRFKLTKTQVIPGSQNRFKLFGKRLRLAFVPKIKNIKFSPKQFAKSMKTKISKGFKGMVKKLKNPKGLVKKYASGIGKVQSFFNGISIAVSAVMIYLDDKKWKGIESELKKNLGYYKQYEKDLKIEKDKLKNTHETMADVLVEQVNEFKGIAENFTAGFKVAMDQSGIIESFGETTEIPKEGVQIALIANINRDNVLEKQTQVRNVVQNADFSLKIYRNFLEGFKITLQIIKDGIKNKQEFMKIVEVLKISFKNNEKLKNLADTFTNINKILCALANLLPDKTHFESIPLESIKEPCMQADAVVTTMTYKKERTAFGLKFIIQSTVHDTKAKGITDDLYELAATVNRFISNDPLVIDVRKVEPTSKTFMCMIADAMPDLNEYFYFDLRKVRGNACSNMSDDDFFDEFSNAEEIADTWKKINRYRKAGKDPCKSRSIKKSGLIPC